MDINYEALKQIIVGRIEEIKRHASFRELREDYDNGRLDAYGAILKDLEDLWIEADPSNSADVDYSPKP